MIIWTDWQIFYDTWRLILHCQQQTLVVDRKIDSPKVQSVIRPVPKVVYSVSELVYNFASVAEPDYIQRVYMSIGPKLCLIKSITSESGTIKYLCMIPILFYQVYGNSNVEKGISVITGLLINKLDLICR